MAETKKMFTVFSLKMANWLVRQGHDMLQVIDSPYDSTGRYKAFLFEDTPELQNNISNYTIITKRKRSLTKHVQTTNVSVADNRGRI